MRESITASETALVAEYQNGQRYVNFVGQVMWQGQSLLLGAALAGAAVGITVAPSLPNLIAVSVLAMVVVLVVEIGRRIWVRHLESLDIAWTRLREIEAILGLRLNIYFDVLRRWPEREPKYLDALSETEWSKLELDYPKYTTARVSRVMSDVVARIIQAGWVVLAVGKWLHYSAIEF